MKYILLSVYLLSSIFAQSQGIKVKVGPLLTPKEIITQMEVPKFKPVRVTDLIPSGHFFDVEARRTFTSFAFTGNNVRFMCSEEFIKPSGVKAFSAEFLQPKETEKINVVRLLNHKGKLFIFYIINNDKKDQSSLYVNEVSKDLVLMGSPILIQNYNTLSGSGSDIYFVSSQNQKFFAAYRLIKTRPKEPQQFECKVINSDFAEVWNKSFQLDSKDRDFNIHSVRVDDSANFYMLGEKTEKSGTQPVLHYYSPATKLLKTFPLGLEEGVNFGSNLKVFDGIPYIVGLNQLKKEVRCFVARLDVNSEKLQQLSVIPMPEDFYKASNFNAFKTEHWNVTELVSLENGNIVASMEARLVVTKNGSPIGYYTYYTYLFSFTPEGQQKLQHTIYKIQGAPNEFVGHNLIPFKNKVFVIYNDHPSNIKLDPHNKKVEGYTGKVAMIVVQEIDENGKVIKYPLSKDPSLTNFNLSMRDLIKLKDNLYFSSATQRKNMFSLNDRNVVFEIE